jgi:dTDP-4-dehydrorhamnose 3,5-epimerase
MVDLEYTPFPDLVLLNLPDFKDQRGAFCKTFQYSWLKNTGLSFGIKESYYSFSNKNVIRGMHFQKPPYDHHKIVYCPLGSITDVVLDLRRSSPKYGQYYSVELSDQNHKAIVIPSGFAHGFKSNKDHSLTCYLVTSEYHKDYDSGILYNSFGFDWQVSSPVLSERDLSFIGLADFDSNF